jgi:23S rRNA (adenine-N6)-dimethyltransferase
MSASQRANLVISQNFIKDPRLVTALIERSSLGPEDLTVEIGPGKGIITAQLAQRCKQVIAIEKDPALADILRQMFESRSNVTICCADFLDYPLPCEPYKVFSNIPFNVTSAIITRLTTATNPPRDTYLVLQKEAAEMYLGVPHESLRSILLQPWFELGLVHRFRRSDFSPRPHVDSVLLWICKRNRPLVQQPDRQLFRDFIVYGFTAWQPTLGDIFKDIFSYRQIKQISRNLKINLKATPTTLQLVDWLNLFETFKEIAGYRAIERVRGSEQRLRRQQRILEKIHRTRLR